MNSGYIKPPKAGVYKVKCRANEATKWAPGWAKFDGLFWYERKDSPADAANSDYQSLVAPSNREWEDDPVPDSPVSFWMVLGKGQPSVRHPTHEAALKEAKRLSQKHPGEQFVVLQAVNLVQVLPAEPTVTKL